MGRSDLTPELQDLIHRVAAHPHGLGFLHLAPLESVAITLGVDPRTADEARQWMETPEGRARLIEAVRQARGEGAPPPGPPPAGPSVDLHLARDVEDLVARARAHPLGISFLLRAPLESVAVTLEAHPLLVLEAREQLHRRTKKDAEERKDDSV